MLEASSRLRLKQDEVTAFQQITQLATLERFSAEQFVRFCGYLYENSGYRVHVAPQESAADLFLERDERLSVVWCQQDSRTLDAAAVDELIAVMHYNEASGAALMSTGEMGQDAVYVASNAPVTLVSGEQLLDWMAQIRPQTPILPKKRMPTWIWGIVALFLVLGLCAATLFYTAGVVKERISGPPAPTLFLPTLPATLATTTEVAAEIENEATSEPDLELAPTATLEAVDAANLNAIFFSNPPTLDGDLSDWDGIETIAVNHITEREGSWDGSMDIDSQWRLGWDNDFLYLAVLVEDDVHVQTQVPKFSYLGDSLELQFDINLEADYSTAVNGDDYQYLISPGNFVELPPDGFRFRGNANGLMSDAAGTALQVVAIANEGGYIIEMAIPWQDMGLGAVGEGVKLGAALSINDNDTPGSAKQELMLSHVASRRWADPSSWGTLTLVKN